MATRTFQQLSQKLMWLMYIAGPPRVWGPPVPVVLPAVCALGGRDPGLLQASGHADSEKVASHTLHAHHQHCSRQERSELKGQCGGGGGGGGGALFVVVIYMYRSFSEHLNICRSWSQMLFALWHFQPSPFTEKWTILVALSLKTSRILSSKSFSHVNHCELEQQRLVGQNLSLNVSGRIETAH